MRHARSALASQLVGSYAKPEWLADHHKAYALRESWWRVSPDLLPDALDDAVSLAIADQEVAGLDFITDGEQRRQSFTGYFFRLGGVDMANWSPRRPGAAKDIEGYVDRQPSASSPLATGPTVTGPITWPGPLSVDDLRYLRRATRRRVKATVIGPATFAMRVADQYYGSVEQLMFAVADALNHELRALAAAGADLIQIDDPEIHFSLSEVRHAVTEALDRMTHGVTTRTAVHICYGYARTTPTKRVNPKYAEALALIAASAVDEISIEYEQPGHQPDLLPYAGDKAVILGLLNLAPGAPDEPVEHIIRRAKEAMQVIPPERLRLAPDCGMWFLPRERAKKKITNLALAARSLQNELL
ncbi:MAG: cobalamin-independent methionine synthase II family protein [Dehalococcoidia bacterium]|nr:cobalamin-independent methionine synthase II family protein [Dehalococcoidia bacterium]